MDGAQDRIAVVGPVHPYRGGIAHFTEMTVEALSDSGHDVCPVSFSRQYPELLFPGKTQFEPDDEAPVSIRGTPQILDPINPLSWLRTVRHLWQLRPDAVVFQYWMPFFAPAYGTVTRLLNWAEIPSLAVVHNALPHERHFGDAQLSRFFLRSCSGHVVLSDTVADDTRKLAHPDAPITQIEHPVYERFGTSVPKADARATLGLPQEASVLLFFGFVREYKGLHVLLEALPAIVEQVPTAHLVIAGEPYDDPDRYREIIDRHELGYRVHWHDSYVPSEEVPNYFCAADLVVQPYLSATQSGVAQIAFHFEVPMVVTDVGGLAEVIPHEQAGFVVPPRNPTMLSEAVVRFFEEEWSSRLVEGVRKQKRQYAPARLVEALEALVAQGRSV